eukprot:jgi/Picsp_1/4608/NSC_01978-R1_pre-rrna-processing protein tsr1 homolog
MAGPGAQKNKAHKAGRRAGRSAREKHREKRDVTHRIGIKSQRRNQSKAERLNAAKQVRDKKRAETMHAKRMAAFLPPRVVAILPLSSQANFGVFWNKLVYAAQHSGESGDDGNAMEEDVNMPEELRPITMVASRQKKIKLTLLPPLTDASDPFAVIDLGKCADTLICLIPATDADMAIDSAGSQALSILRSLGLPSTLAVAQSGVDSMNLKERSAAKKRASDALSALLPSDNYKMMLADSAVDFKQIVRHLVETTPVVPIWRTQRSHIIPQKAEFVRSEKISSSGTLLLTGYVRNRALSANQVIHIPSAGDFQIEKIETVIDTELKNLENRPGTSKMETEEVLAVSAPEEREPLTRENEVDLLDAEQTWPTEEEIAEAERNAAMRRRRLPKGTSDYQAAWIVDDDFSDISDEDDNDSMPERPMEGQIDRNGDTMQNTWIEDDVGTEFDPEEFNRLGLVDEKEAARAREEDSERRAREADDVLYPDEFELPHDVTARQRLARFRGLKSFRTSPWDPKEDLPLDYARVFAFENFKRAQRRALDLAAKVNHNNGPCGADVGMYVCIHICNVPVKSGLEIVQRVEASSQGMAPMTSAWGLLQHETKLSVLNFSIKKDPGCEEPIPNKEELCFVTGIRSFSAKPIFSTDEHGADKHKMERFLHDGRMSMATIYGPIMYPPCPLLAFKKSSVDGNFNLVATGSLKSCNPDRVIVKKIVLTGFPVKAHRSKAVKTCDGSPRSSCGPNMVEEEG